MTVLAHIVRIFAAAAVGLIVAHIVTPEIGLIDYALIALTVAAATWVCAMIMLTLGERKEEEDS